MGSSKTPGINLFANEVSVTNDALQGLVGIWDSRRQARAIESKEKALETEGYNADLEGKKIAEELTSKYNKAMSNAVVSNAVRGSGNVEGIKALNDKLNLERDYSSLATQITTHGIDANKNILKGDREAALSSGYFNMVPHLFSATKKIVKNGFPSTEGLFSLIGGVK